MQLHLSHDVVWRSVLGFNNIIKLQSQECIPVGCVTPLVDHIPPCTTRGGCLPGGCLTPREQNDWQTVVKTLPCRNFFAGGDNGNKILQQEDTTDDNAQSDMCHPFNNNFPGLDKRWTVRTDNRLTTFRVGLHWAIVKVRLFFDVCRQYCYRRCKLSIFKWVIYRLSCDLNTSVRGRVSPSRKSFGHIW